MSKHATGAPDGGSPIILSAYDDADTPGEISRRQFMANATLVIGGIVGLGLAIPIVGSLVPSGGSSKGNWSPLTADEFKALVAATAKPVKLTFTQKSQDSYLPEQDSQEYVWGIKADPEKFKAARPDIFTKGPNGPPDVDYSVVNMSFVIFSPICPHLGCRPAWNDDSNRFVCPCHGSQFGFDGEHLSGPAPRGLDPLPLQEKDGIAQIMWVRYQGAVPDRVVISYQS